MAKVITINRPMVLIPLEEYELLLKEAGEKPTPKLMKEISQARREFRKRKTIKWEKLKRDLKLKGI
ncbi:MAG: hypothetical protein DRI36_05795 [Caldiserica bacterium]|nr:MAG: hypothetical protein DRI36_05795 [Caldisericota bacterium]